ncbi:MAG: PadR family transcriptional regulator [Oscillospiraceae bacterium]
MGDQMDVFASLSLELRRGTIVLSVLSQLDAPKYGYALVQSMEERGAGIEPGTLYPLLRRLEKQGLLMSEWETEGAKPRKYYRRTPFGDGIYLRLREQWEQLVQNMEQLLKEGTQHEKNI